MGSFSLLFYYWSWLRALSLFFWRIYGWLFVFRVLTFIWIKMRDIKLPFFSFIGFSIMIRRFGLITLFLASMASANFLRDCHSTDPKPYIYHGTKTPYELINNEDSSPIFVAGKYVVYIQILTFNLNLTLSDFRKAIQKGGWRVYIKLSRLALE